MVPRRPVDHEAGHRVAVEVGPLTPPGGRRLDDHPVLQARLPVGIAGMEVGLVPAPAYRRGYTGTPSGARSGTSFRTPRHPRADDRPGPTVSHGRSRCARRESSRSTSRASAVAPYRHVRGPGRQRRDPRGHGLQRSYGANTPAGHVQIGDPYTQKKMHDFLLEARDEEMITFITDNGGGGLSSSVGESAILAGALMSIWTRYLLNMKGSTYGKYGCRNPRSA